MAWSRYKIIKEVGNGTFGSVWRALNNQTGEVVCVILVLKKVEHLVLCFPLSS